ncbi:hypothetical protein HCN50_07545 [Bradyrhizobium sp. WSM 1744]|uniref:Uncharacterized protein n=1 Tax=Bradyrhizobium archetypum TaxID=2721160 RepID=A0A7Y4H1U8_9BRAD|nr:hypothetical protein [Bradyrhizobium archetypum]
MITPIIVEPSMRAEHTGLRVRTEPSGLTINFKRTGAPAKATLPLGWGL